MRNEIKNAVIAYLSGAAEKYNDKEFKWKLDKRRSTISTLEFINDGTDKIISRHYRKDGNLWWYCEYNRDGKKHGKFEKINSKGDTQSSIYNNGILLESSIKNKNGLDIKRYTNKGKLDGKRIIETKKYKAYIIYKNGEIEESYISRGQSYSLCEYKCASYYPYRKINSLRVVNSKGKTIYLYNGKDEWIKSDNGGYYSKLRFYSNVHNFIRNTMNVDFIDINLTFEEYIKTNEEHW